MAAHKFLVGDSVTFVPNMGEDKSARGLYTVVRLLPAEGVTPLYRLKDEAGGPERVVGEGQLFGSFG